MAWLVWKTTELMPWLSLHYFSCLRNSALSPLREVLAIILLAFPFVQNIYSSLASKYKLQSINP